WAQLGPDPGSPARTRRGSGSDARGASARARQVARLMVELTAPQPTDVVCDPACGTAGFLVAAGEYLRERHPKLLHDKKLNEHFHHRMFHGFDFDSTMLRIGSMNMLLHGVESPDIQRRDALAQDHAGEEEKYTPV